MVHRRPRCLSCKAMPPGRRRKPPTNLDIGGQAVRPVQMSTATNPDKGPTIPPLNRKTSKAVSVDMGDMSGDHGAGLRLRLQRRKMPHHVWIQPQRNDGWQVVVTPWPQDQTRCGKEHGIGACLRKGSLKKEEESPEVSRRVILQLVNQFTVVSQPTPKVRLPFNLVSVNLDE